MYYLQARIATVCFMMCISVERTTIVITAFMACLAVTIKVTVAFAMTTLSVGEAAMKVAVRSRTYARTEHSRFFEQNVCKYM